MITIATRGSLLAMWQAGHVQASLAGSGTANTAVEVIRTTGDRITDVPLSRIGGQGLFTRELDEAVLDGRADCAVHSLKDVPTQLPDGLVLAAILEREDPRDAWLARDGIATIDSLPAGARVGTSSLRRRALLLALRPDLAVVDMRGNLDTRLEKLHDGECDAMILALAGLRRLGRKQEVTATLDAPGWLPAPGQGAIAVVARAGDHAVLAALQPLDDAATHAAVSAERTLLRTLEGGCQVPIGALATVDASRITLHAVVSDPEGVTVLRASGSDDVADAARLGMDVAARLLADGAEQILDALRAAGGPDTPAISPP